MNPTIFLTVNGVLLNAADIQQARAAAPEGDQPAGLLVHFISGGWATIPDITVEQFEAVLTSAVKDAAPF